MEQVLVEILVNRELLSTNRNQFLNILHAGCFIFNSNYQYERYVHFINSFAWLFSTLKYRMWGKHVSWAAKFSLIEPNQQHGGLCVLVLCVYDRMLLRRRHLRSDRSDFYTESRAPLQPPTAPSSPQPLSVCRSRSRRWSGASSGRSSVSTSDTALHTGSKPGLLTSTCFWSLFLIFFGDSDAKMYQKLMQDSHLHIPANCPVSERHPAKPGSGNIPFTLFPNYQLHDSQWALTTWPLPVEKYL